MLRMIEMVGIVENFSPLCWKNGGESMQIKLILERLHYTYCKAIAWVQPTMYKPKVSTSIA